MKAYRRISDTTEVSLNRGIHRIAMGTVFKNEFKF